MCRDVYNFGVPMRELSADVFQSRRQEKEAGDALPPTLHLGLCGDEDVQKRFVRRLGVVKGSDMFLFGVCLRFYGL